MVKRGNNQAGNPAKKVKADPVLASITDTIMQCEDLPWRCRAMLVDALPLSLSVPEDKRHDIQSAIVNMAKQTLNSQKSAMQAAVSMEEQTISKLHSSQNDLEKIVGEAESVLIARKEASQAAQTLLTDAAGAADIELQTLNARRAEHKESADKLAAGEAEKLAIESAFEAHFKPMKEGPAGSHFKELEPHLKHLELEASLLIAVPSSCAKPREERGSFDTVVLEELEKSLSSKIAALGDTLKKEAPIAAQHETAVRAAQEEYDAKMDTQKRAAADLEPAQEEEQNAEADLCKAREAVSNLQPEVNAAMERLEKAKLDVEAFEVGPLAKFSAYSSATSPLSSIEAAPSGA